MAGQTLEDQPMFASLVRFSWRWREVRCGRVTTGRPTNVYITGTIQLEVEGSKVWQGDHWRTNQCLHHWYDSAGGGGK